MAWQQVSAHYLWWYLTWWQVWYFCAQVSQCVHVCSGLATGTALVLDEGLWPVGRQNIWNCSGHFQGRLGSWRSVEPGILVLGVHQVVGAKRCMQAG